MSRPPRHPFRKRALQVLVFGALLGAGFTVATAVGAASTSRDSATTTGTTATRTGSTTATTTKTVTKTVTTTTTVASPPSNTGLPGISGKLQDGQLLTASAGSWRGSPSSYAYQWLRCDSNGAACGSIRDANGRQYTLTSSDIGHRLRVQVTASNSHGSGSATSSATGVVQAGGNAPANTKLPSLSGSLQQGSTLTASVGKWSGSSPIAYDYTWQRCDSGGNNCSTFITHDPQATHYTLGTADVGHRMRVEVQAKNAYGSSYVYTAVTSAVQGPKAPPPPRGSTIPVASVSLPDRLVINGVSFTPSTLRSRRPVLAHFHVADLHGLSVQGALVYVLGLPYSWTGRVPEEVTAANGWVTLEIRPSRAMPLKRGALVLFVRARKPGDSLLAGVSTRRLVQVSIR